MAKNDKPPIGEGPKSTTPDLGPPAIGRDTPAFVAAKMLEPSNRRPEDADPVTPPRALLWSVKLRDGGVVMAGTSPTEDVNPLDPAKPGWDVIVQGPSVLIAAPPTSPAAQSSLRDSRGAPTPAFADICEAHRLEPEAARSLRFAYELPRSAVILRWLVPAELDGEQLAQAVLGRGFQAVASCPDGSVRELRRRRARDEADRKAAVALVKSAKGKAAVAPEDRDDGFVGSGPAGEVEAS